jgi:cytochrome c-type biogenesis protein CcmH/NrfG
MAGRVKTWVWVIVGIAAVGILCVIALAAAGIYYFTQHIEAPRAEPAHRAR